MSIIESGQTHVATRARLMLLLGEQLITDEIAAVSELVKNSYDADAENVTVTLSNVSNPKEGSIIVKDDGNGMSLKTVFSSWLELGTLSKARGPNQRFRVSEFKKRLFLGEKGLGRLAVHKLGYVTTLVTRRKGENSETRLTIDWTLFEQDGFLDQVPVKWESMKPELNNDPPQGTCIIITKLRREWTPLMIKRVKENILALKSPFTEFSDFNLDVQVNDENSPEINVPDMANLVKNATYTFTATVNESGELDYHYKFTRPDLPDLFREEFKKTDLKSSEFFKRNRKPTCGAFGIKVFSWDASIEDQKAVFDEETSIYKKMIRPNSGVKLFRDGFRVYPYGNVDNDWLGMDARRIGQSFELRLSRSQVIGALEISSKTNPLLIDKTDREGLIDNQAFEDFVYLIISAIAVGEAERYIDRRKLKEATGRIRDENVDKAIFTRNLAALSRLVGEQDKLPGEAKLAFNNLIVEARSSFESVLSEKEQPLLVAASFGITYLLPTHEIKRNIDEALKILNRVRKSAQVEDSRLDVIAGHLRQAGDITNGLARLGMKSEEEDFCIKKAAEGALDFMKDRMSRNLIKCSIEGPDSIKAKGKENLVTMLLLNLLDNSIYWLLRKKPAERQIKIIVGEYVNRPILIVSDSGQGFEDDLNIVTLPFFSRKPDGMGLGLYISDRIAKMNGGHLLMLNTEDFPGLLSGANIGVSLQNCSGKK